MDNSAVYQTSIPSIRELQAHSRDLDASTNEGEREVQNDKASRGEQTADNIRCGEAISEHGFGGETMGNTGVANQGVGYGGTEEDNGNGSVQSRRVQGYGGGSEVGA